MLRHFHPFKPKRQDVNVLCLDGGLGDHVGGSLIAINHILIHYSWVNLLIWTPDFLVEFAENVLPRNACVRGFSNMKKYNRHIHTLSTEWDGRTSPLRIHCADYAFLKLCDEMVPLDKKNYLRVYSNSIDISRYQLPKLYVVFVVGFTAGVREFNPIVVNEVTRYCEAKGYTPIFLGQSSTVTGQKQAIEMQMRGTIDMSYGINLINQTTLLEAAKVIEGAQAIVAVDCGLMHVAGCTDTPIVGGYTTVAPEYRMPIRHNQIGYKFYPIVPDKSLLCRFCQSGTNFLHQHNYKYCIYDDYECVKGLKASQFITELDKIL